LRALLVSLTVSLALLVSSRAAATPQEVWDVDCLSWCAGWVAVSGPGNLLLVGSIDGTFGTAKGLLFERAGDGTFNHVQTIPTPAGVAGDQFSYGPMVFSDAEDTALISATRTPTALGEPQQGAVYVLARAGAGSFSSIQQLVSSNPEHGNRFGSAIALSSAGDLVVIGSSGDNIGSVPGGVDFAPSGGSVDVFERMPDGTFGSLQQLTAPVPTEPARFGGSVALSDSGDILVVGSSEHSPGGGYAAWPGMADVFVRDPAGTFSHVQALYAGDGQNWDRFGAALELSGSGEVLLVGVPWRALFEGDPDVAHDGIPFTGAVEVFLRQADGSYQFHQELAAPMAVGWEFFGQSVGLSRDGKLAVIGAPGAVGFEASGLDSGAVHVFARRASGLFEYAQELANPLSYRSDQYGVEVAVSDAGESVIVGAGEGDVALAFAFPDSDEDGVLDVLDNCSADPNPDQLDLDSDDEGDVCDADLDGDGLVNEAETNDGVFVDTNQSGTDPLVFDTDGDGWGDGYEAVLGSDPTDSASEPPVALPGVAPLGLGILGAAMGAFGALGLRARRRASPPPLESQSAARAEASPLE